MGFGKFLRQLALFPEKFRARNQHRRRDILLVDEYFPARLPFQPRNPWFHGPDGINLLLLEKLELIGILGGNDLGIPAQLRDFQTASH